MTVRLKSFFTGVREFVRTHRSSVEEFPSEVRDTAGRSFVEEIRIVEHFKLYDAAWCVECDTVFEHGSPICPSCMSTSILCLSAYLRPKEERQEIDTTRVHLSRFHESHPTLAESVR